MCVKKNRRSEKNPEKERKKMPDLPPTEKTQNLMEVR